ncbi:hypothetical protein [Endozoicomonas sp. 8E]|uniref:tetratricopeptide repeat protein n=1 Tax=Endozoicomonas sp. 8E TaxID=3035692 RepID=UPI0029393161|nr:hypothetical protein [Endozoicomonas sp. 8E]WOG26242.1 hypothetical protein P6910_16950 [Endozoicomonas sp. 8E]
MSYGLPTTTTATASSSTTTTATSQSSGYLASGSDTDLATNPTSNLNPEAPIFIPRLQVFDERSYTPSNISDREANAYQSLTPPTLQQRTVKTTPKAIQKEIDDAFKILKNKQFTDAETAFRVILLKYEGTLSLTRERSATIGLARSLGEQTHAKQMEARSLLEKLSLHGTFNSFGASNIYNLDLTLSRCEESLGYYLDAEARLLRLRKKKPGASEQSLCKPSHYFDADITNARLWQAMGKHDRAERLLLNMSGKHPHSSEDILCKPTGNHNIDLGLVRLWEIMGKHKLAERQMLNMRNKHPGNSEEILCKPTGHHSIDLSQVRLWQMIGKYKRAEKLLLSMSGKQLCTNEGELCKPCGNREIDMALSRLWQVMGKNKLTEWLLLNMSGKHPGASEEILCEPCRQHDIDLTLARHWEFISKYRLSERLLLNMIGKRPNDREETLSLSSGYHDIDLALARLWPRMNKPERTERLLLDMSGKSLNGSEESLCWPSGHHDIDLALIYFWKITGKTERAQTLLRRCRDLYHSNECEYRLLLLSAGQAEFMEMISNYPESANILLVTSIHYFSLACEQLTNDDPKSGNDNLMKALEIIESALEKYPHCAGAYSQKGHCLRMLGSSEQEWSEWFKRAEIIDPGRAYKVKTDFWRSNEATALQKVLASEAK